MLLGGLLLAACSGATKQTADPVSLTRATETLDSLYAHYGVEGAFLLRENFPFEGDYKATYLATEQTEQNQPNPYSYLWPYSGTFTAVNCLYEATGNEKYKTLLEQRVLPGLKEYFDSERQPAAYASYLRITPLPDRFYDDNIWLGIDYTDLYGMTGDKRYLQEAEDIWKFIESGTDSVLGGGIYWCEQRRDSKNTCSNAPGSVLALKLFRATADSSYLRQGKALYDWTRQLQDSTDGLYFDHIRLDGTISRPKYAYNSGQMMQAATLLYHLTGEERYLHEAQHIARGCYVHFFEEYAPEGKPSFRLLRKGETWCTAVMLRGFIELALADGDMRYIDAFKQSLDYAWTHARDENGLFSQDFSGRNPDQRKWLLTQAAMVEMYARLAAFPARK